MIRNEREYKEAVERVTAEADRLEAQRKALKASGLTSAEIKRAMDPLVTFSLQLREEVESYEKLLRGNFDEMRNLKGLGRLLVGLRIARGWTQKELADALDVHESQVSRDERNEYHGITLDRASRLLDILEARMTSTIEPPTNDEIRTGSRKKQVAKRA